MFDHVILRRATPADAEAVRRLAVIDSADAPPAEPVLVAERAGSLVAAVSTADGTAIADPFRPTADLVALLRFAARRAA